MYDLVVIGSGPGGYVAAIKAAELGLKVACIEKDPFFGGTCLNCGCIPSKTLLHSSHLFSLLKQDGKSLGITGDFSLDFTTMMQRKTEVITTFRAGIASLFKKHKVESIAGVASLVSPNKVSVKDQEIESKAILLATGSRPKDLPFLPCDEKTILSSTGALNLSRVPPRLVVIGAGVIGVELGSVYQRLGSSVTFVEFADKVCPTFDTDLSLELHKLLKSQGLTFHLSSKVEKITTQEGSSKVHLLQGTSPLTLETDAVLVSIGRVPYTEGLNIEKIGIAKNPSGHLLVDHNFRTNIPSIFAIGDLIDGPMLAHKASEEGTAVAKILAGKEALVDYAAIPSIIYTHPEVASVGLSELQVQEIKLPYQKASMSFKFNSRAQCSKEAEGFVKILIHQESKKILGVHMIGARASELIAEGCLAIHKRLTIKDISETPSCPSHPL